MAFNPNSSEKKQTDQQSHGFYLVGILRRIDRRKIRKGDNAGESFQILKITTETDNFQVFDVLDFSNTPFTLGQLVTIPVSASSRVSPSGYSSVSYSHRVSRNS